MQLINLDRGSNASEYFTNSSILRLWAKPRSSSFLYARSISFHAYGRVVVQWAVADIGSSYNALFVYGNYTTPGFVRILLGQQTLCYVLLPPCLGPSGPPMGTMTVLTVGTLMVSHLFCT